MRRFRFPVIMLMMFFLALNLIACGGGGGGDGSSSVVSHEPAIWDIQLDRTSAFYMEGGGVIDVTADLNYFDEGKDITKCIVTDDEGTSLEIPLNWVTPPAEQGWVIITVLVETTEVGTFNWSIYCVDSLGATSNTLNGTFTVF